MADSGPDAGKCVGNLFFYPPTMTLRKAQLGNSTLPITHRDAPYQGDNAEEFNPRRFEI